MAVSVGAAGALTMGCRVQGRLRGGRAAISAGIVARPAPSWFVPAIRAGTAKWSTFWAARPPIGLAVIIIRDSMCSMVSRRSGFRDALCVTILCDFHAGPCGRQTLFHSCGPKMT